MEGRKKERKKGRKKERKKILKKIQMNLFTKQKQAHTH